MDDFGKSRDQESADSLDLDQAKLVTVARRHSEVAATVLVTVLANEGIRAVATGGYTAGFRAEAPGEVRVLTFESDAERARAIIEEIEADMKSSLDSESFQGEPVDGESFEIE